MCTSAFAYYTFIFVGGISAWFAWLLQPRFVSHNGGLQEVVADPAPYLSNPAPRDVYHVNIYPICAHMYGLHWAYV